MQYLNLSAIRSWKLRLAAIILLGVPLLSGWPLNQLTVSLKLSFPTLFEGAGRVSDSIPWIIYAFVVWGVVASSVGARKFMEYLTIAFVFGVTTALLGGAMRRIFPIMAGSATEVEVSLRMLKLLITIITVVPFSLFSLNSFSAKSIIAKLANTKGRRGALGLHLALTLRVCQHAGEVILNLFQFWTEEHPHKVIPRHRRAWDENWYSLANVVPWVWSALFTWIYATTIHTFEPIPGMVHDVESINHARRLTTQGASDHD